MMERFRSLNDGDAALVEVVGLGSDAIPSLRRLLFARETSGLFQSRCRAVEAIASLKAFPVLADFLRSHRDSDDPVERLGDDAVKSAAWRALARLHEPWIYDLLLEHARHRPLLGILAGLGAFLRTESIPIFVEALGEDHLRLTAHGVLRAFGGAAWPALIAAALDPGQDQLGESESHLRKRRSALILLLESKLSRKSWPSLRTLINDHDLQVALLACELCLEIGGARDRAQLCDRLVNLRRDADWSARARLDDLSRRANCDRHRAQLGA
ncbi:MAG: hypothetical protein J0H32_11685 [Rhizobiales bacterium]|nr:hypothetical protein [Hyphomicrobiales bacterium]